MNWGANECDQFETRKQRSAFINVVFIENIFLFLLHITEGGVAALRVLELIPGFWSCSKGFGEKCEHLSHLLLKVI